MKTNTKTKTQSGQAGRKTGKTKKNGMIVETKTLEQPLDDEIRELAEILYHQRIDRGEPGSEIEDWLTAESYLKNS